MDFEDISNMGSEDQIRALRAQEIKDIANRKQALQEKSKAIGEYAAKAPQGDPALTELLTTASDTWAGTNLAKNLKPDPSLTQGQNVEKLRAALLKEEQDLSEAQRDMIKQAVNADLAKQRMNYGMAKENTFSQEDIQKYRSELSNREPYKGLQAAQKLRESTKQFRDLVTKHGGVFRGTTVRDMEALRTSMALAFKEAAALGALTGADMTLIDQTIPNAIIDSPKAFYEWVAKGGKQGVISALDVFDNEILRGANNTVNSLKDTYPMLQNDKIITRWHPTFKAESALAAKPAAQSGSIRDQLKTMYGKK